MKTFNKMIRNYCKEFKISTYNMTKKCGCGKQPIFGLPGESATCCSDCKTDQMINVRSKRCNCGKIPSFALPGESATCCSDCKTDKMINVVGKK